MSFGRRSPRFGFGSRLDRDLDDDGAGTSMGHSKRSSAFARWWMRCWCSRGRTPVRRGSGRLSRLVSERVGVLARVPTSAAFDVADATARPVGVQPQRLAQVLDNLVANALEAPPDGVTVTVRAAGEAELHVPDDGPGMTPEQRDRAFDRFWRAGSAPAARAWVSPSCAASSRRTRARWSWPMRPAAGSTPSCGSAACLRAYFPLKKG